ncbi:hypothetical protein CRE_25458 [Caenorhabditis remanei]|uniref:MADF domain-containing protein n=1 Tax=Caenorhabditis remanei TaxID=31234 RepID=E3LT98_CAERE|nr:hypothetical protein CRE_25458 [Caenorhabditis remanei]
MQGDELENSSDEESKKISLKNKNSARRYRKISTSNESKRKKKLAVIPTSYEELKKKTDAGVIPETIYYRASSNSMYIPSITADMIQDDGKNLTVETSSDEYFKYARARQTTKSDHAEPEKVFQIIEAVRKRPGLVSFQFLIIFFIPVIWDQRLICHQNINLIRRAWQDLDTEIGIDEEYPLARRKQIWKSKKDYYSYAYNSETLGKWTYTSAMEFYQPMVNFRTTVCLRPTILVKTGESPSMNLFDKVVLADKNIQCTASDKLNVLTFILKSLHDTGMADVGMMESHGKRILEIFETNVDEAIINATFDNSHDEYYNLV